MRAMVTLLWGMGMGVALAGCIFLSEESPHTPGVEDTPRDLSCGPCDVGEVCVSGACASAWLEPAPEPARAIGMGSALATSEEVLVVGAPRWRDGQDRAVGAVMIYSVEVGGSVTLVQQLSADGDARADAAFGATVALRGDWLAVGAPGEASGQGAVYLFEREGVSWERRARVVAAERRNYGGFGMALALDEDRLVVSEPHIYEGRLLLAPIRERVHVFEGASRGWPSAGQLDSPGDGRFFGLSLAASQGQIFVGTPGLDEGGTDAGAVLVFARMDDAWREVARVSPEESREQGAFGLSVAVRGDRLLVGEPSSPLTEWQGPRVGRAVLFERAETQWRQRAVLQSSALGEGGYFGWSVALNSTHALIGAARESEGRGAVYLFELSGAAVGELLRMTPEEDSGAGRLGFSVALSERLGVGGAESRDRVRLIGLGR